MFTDSKPLVCIFSSTKSIPVLSASRMQRHALYLQIFQYNILYKKNTEHKNADALSRLLLRSEDLTLQVNSSNVIDEFEFFSNKSTFNFTVNFQYHLT